MDYTGKYMLHCHMMNHEELGMMQVVESIRRPLNRRLPEQSVSSG
jgi:hypothetical protein